jgi:Fe2+ transport system protein B
MELLTIAEFAEKVGLTKQAIYKRLETDLAPFLVVENGTKKLKAEALELYKSNFETKQTGREQELLERIKELESLVATLTQDKIDLLQKSAEDKEKLWDFAERLAKIQENSQILLAQNNQVVSSLTQPVSTRIEASNEVEKVELNSNKQSWFSRMFKRP